LTREPYHRDKNSDKEKMSLPEDKTCGDCYHFTRCNKIFGHIAEDMVCDWAPSKFYEPKRLLEKGLSHE
jgi:hypothetical protein